MEILPLILLLEHKLSNPLRAVSDLPLNSLLSFRFLFLPKPHVIPFKQFEYACICENVTNFNTGNNRLTPLFSSIPFPSFNKYFVLLFSGILFRRMTQNLNTYLFISTHLPMSAPHGLIV